MAALSIVIASTVAYIAYQQWRVSRDKLKLDLFNRRYEMFDATRTFLKAMCGSGEAYLDDISKFDAATVGVDFLFGADVVAYLASIKETAIQMRTDRKLCGQAGPEKLAWQADRLSELQQSFAPYLDFSHVRVYKLRDLVRPH